MKHRLAGCEWSCQRKDSSAFTRSTGSEGTAWCSCSCAWAKSGVIAAPAVAAATVKKSRRVVARPLEWSAMLLRSSPPRIVTRIVTGRNGKQEFYPQVPRPGHL